MPHSPWDPQPGLSPQATPWGAEEDWDERWLTWEACAAAFLSALGLRGAALLLGALVSGAGASDLLSLAVGSRKEAPLHSLLFKLGCTGSPFTIL